MATRVDWVRQLRKTPRFPPIVFLGTGEERQIVAAIKAGADDYVTRSTLTHPRLIEAMEQALAADGHARRFRRRARPAMPYARGPAGAARLRTRSHAQRGRDRHRCT